MMKKKPSYKLRILNEYDLINMIKSNNIVWNIRSLKNIDNYYQNKWNNLFDNSKLWKVKEYYKSINNISSNNDNRDNTLFTMIQSYLSLNSSYIWLKIRGYNNGFNRYLYIYNKIKNDNDKLCLFYKKEEDFYYIFFECNKYLNFCININVLMPHKISKKQIALLEEFKKESNENSYRANKNLWNRVKHFFQIQP